MKAPMKILGRAAFVVSVLFSASSFAAEKVTYYHWDATGSPVAATDEQGNVVWRKSYKPYGEETQTPTTPTESRSFTGHVLDSDTGLLYTGARYYDPTIGRFMAIDPAPFTEKNIHSFNRYSYANNNPYRYVDPDGRFPIDTVWDAGNVVYDVFTGNWGDLAADLGAMAIPYVPAGVTKLRHLDNVIDASKASQKGPTGADPDIIYRGGGSNPGNLKTRPDESAVSFRDSLSNPIDSKQRPVFKPGDQYIGVDAKKLPPGSVVRDNSPPGHVSVKAPPEQIRDAVVEKGKFPR